MLKLLWCCTYLITVSDHHIKLWSILSSKHIIIFVFLCRYFPIFFVCLLLSRRQELRELRLLQKEEQRAQQQLSNKLQQQKEQIYRRFEQETTVSFSTQNSQCWRFQLCLKSVIYRRKGTQRKCRCFFMSSIRQPCEPNLPSDIWFNWPQPFPLIF